MDDKWALNTDPPRWREITLSLPVLPLNPEAWGSPLPIILDPHIVVNLEHPAADSVIRSWRSA